MIELEKLSVSYDGRTSVLSKLSLEVKKGELLVLLGTSGSGKSTALRCINRLVQPTSGRVLVDERDVAKCDVIALRRSIGYVLQRFALFRVGRRRKHLPRGLRAYDDRSRRAASARAKKLLRDFG